MSQRSPYTPQQRSYHPSPAQQPQRPHPAQQHNSAWSVTGVLMDEDYVRSLDLEHVPSRTVGNIASPLFQSIQENIKEKTGMDLDSDIFEDRQAKTEIYVGTDLGSGQDGGRQIDTMNINRNKLLFAFYPGGPVAREYLKDVETGKSQLKTVLREVVQEKDASKPSSSLTKKKGKGLANDPNPSLLEQLYEKIREFQVTVEDIRAENQQFRTENQQFRAENQQLKLEFKKLNIDFVKTNIRALHRRVLLDQVRAEMIALSLIPSTTTPTPDNRTLNEIVRQVTQNLRKEGLKMLEEPAIRAVFDSSLETLRSPGNYAAHNAPDDYIAEAVLDTTLPGHYKKICIELFVWLKGKQPALGVNI